ncbi:MAG TPA: carboxypeptidase-like regulatory domain-containing protein [Gemmatimonadaceae bacterium]|nr:carboxypeptidase-like regulatory domain-containing protein [Gemmatimonadaceae bacterium]
MTGGLARVSWTGAARTLATLATLVAFGAAATLASAQVIHGTLRTQQLETPVTSARVAANDSAGIELGATTSDARGYFILAIRSRAPFRLNVLKIGWLPSSSALMTAAPGDTLDLDMLVPADPTAIAAVEIKGEGNKSFNTLHFEEALRHGWKVYSPELVEFHRNNSASFTALMREVGVSGVQIDDHANSSGQFCARAVRYMTQYGKPRCLAYILDGVPSGSFVYVNPRDVYFFAVLNASESASRWGDKAPWGAIVIYTRMNGDKKNP